MAALLRPAKIETVAFVSAGISANQRVKELLKSANRGLHRRRACFETRPQF